MRADLRAAIGHALFAEANRDRNKRPAPYPARGTSCPTRSRRRRSAIRELQDSGSAARFAGMDGGRKGENLKAWRRERAGALGKARQ
jgi:hypothetical protein